MGGESKLWLVSAGLLAAGAGLGAASVALSWAPCSGQYGLGSIFEESNQIYTDACLIAMDQHSGTLFADGASLAGLLGGAAAALLALAWLVLVPTTRLSRAARLWVALPGILVLAQVAAVVVGGLAGAEPTVTSLGLALDLAVVPALVLLSRSGNRGWGLVRYGLVLLAATATGSFHLIADYVAAMSLSTANWDTPPGSVGFTVAGIAASAVLTVVFWHSDARARPVPTPAVAGAG